MREKTKIITVNEKEYKLKKFNAFLGIAILKELLARALPISLLNILPSIPFTLPSNASTPMTMDEFVLFQAKIIKEGVVAVLETGDTPLINENGSEGVVGILDDISIILPLLYEVLIFNYKDFFIESLSKMGFLEKLQSVGGNNQQPQT